MEGTIPDEILPAVLDALGLELTVLDACDRVIAWTEPCPPLFGRPENILGKDVMECHPPRSHVAVRKLLDDMKASRTDSIVHVKEKIINGTTRKVRIEYRALRDAAGRYIGCIEIAGLLG